MVDNAYFDLPGDILFQILMKLPVTSLCGCKCVCKRWYDIIESRDFKEKHYALQNNSALLFVVNHSGAAYYYEGKMCSGRDLRVVESVNIPVFTICAIGPCRGLFLICSGQNPEARLGLLNLATKAFRLLPKPSMPNNITDSEGYTTYGLGWCSDTDDYKVVCLLYRRRVAMVYTLSTDSWRLLDSPNLPTWDDGAVILINSQLNVHASGFCYWLPVFQEPRSLISFDLARETFMTISLPPDVTNVESNREKKIYTLSSYCNSPALLAWEKGEVEVWVLQQEESQQHNWTKIFYRQYKFENTRPCGIWNNTHILLRKWRPYPPGPTAGELMAYDMNSHEETVMDSNHVEKVMDACILDYLNYKECMFSIKGGSKNWTPSLSNNHIHDFLNLK